MGIRESNFIDTLFDVILKLVKIFFTFFMVALILFTFDGVVGSSTNNSKKDKYAIVYSDINIITSEIKEKNISKIDIAIGLYNNSRVQNIVVSGNNSPEGKVLLGTMKRYIIEKGVAEENIILTFSESFDELSKTIFTFNKSHGSFPNVGVVGITDFYNVNTVRSSLKNAGFSYVGVESPDYYEFKDVYRVVGKMISYGTSLVMISVNGIADNKDEIRGLAHGVKTKVIVETKRGISGKIAMIDSMNRFYKRELISGVSDYIALLSTYREKQKIFKQNINRYELVKIKDIIDDSLIISKRLSDDFINTGNALSFKRRNEISKVEKNILTSITGFGSKIGDFFQNNSQSY